MSQKDAYEKAGYKARGNVAKVNASQLLTKPNFKKAYKREQAKIAKRTNVTHDMITAGLLKEARGNGADTTTAGRNMAWNYLAKHKGYYELDNKQKADPIAQVLKEIAGRSAPLVKDENG